jgi:hypothetical protein
MAIVCPHLADPKGEPGNNVVDEGDRIGLGVPVVDLERPDAGRIINRGVLVALDRLAVLCRSLNQNKRSRTRLLPRYSDQERIIKP